MTNITKHNPGDFKGFFSEQLDNYLKAIQSPYPNTKVIRPSQIHECQRWIVGDILGVLPFEPKSPVQQRILQNGTYVHKRFLSSYLPRMGLASKILDVKTGKLQDFIEIKLEDSDFWLKGAPDAVIINPNNGRQYVMELKSISDSQFKILEAPKPEHLMQVNLYMYLTNLNDCDIVYEDKDTQGIKEFIIQKDPILLQSLLEKIRLIQRHVVDKTFPPCEYPEIKSCHCKQVMI